MLVPYTPRSSLDLSDARPSTMKTSFLSLPPEIRNQIYTFVLEELHASPPQPLQIWHRARLGWRLYSRSSQPQPTNPDPQSIIQLLQVSRQIYTEALPILCKSLPAGGPTLAIQCGPEPLHMMCTWEEFHGLLGYQRRDAREVVTTTLQGVRRMGLGFGIEVVVPGGGEEQVNVIGLLRWVRALVCAGGGREDLLEAMAVEVKEKWRVGRVCFAYLGWRGNEPRYPSGLWEVLRDWRCEGVQAEYRFYGRHQFGKKQLVEDCESFAIPEPSNIAKIETDEEAAWKAMEAARLRMEKVSTENTNFTFPKRRLVFDCVGANPGQLLAWARRRR